MAARTLDAAAFFSARSLKPMYDGTAMASRMPRMMMTTRSSMSVKPLSSLAIRSRSFETKSMLVVLLLSRWGMLDAVSIGGVRRTARASNGGFGREVDPPRRGMGLARKSTLKVCEVTADTSPRDCDARHPRHGRAALDRRAPRALGRAQRVGPPPHCRRLAGAPRARAHRAARGVPGHGPGPRARARLPDHDHRAAEAARAEPPAGLLVRRARARALPRQRVLPAREHRGGLPDDPDGDQADRGARPAAEPPRAD